MWCEIIEGNNFGICVDPLNSKAIEKLIINKDLRKKIGTNGRKRVMRLYCWNDNEKQMLTIYNKLIGS